MKFTTTEGEIATPVKIAGAAAAIIALPALLFAASTAAPENDWAERRAAKQAQTDAQHRQMVIGDAARRLAAW